MSEQRTLLHLDGREVAISNPAKVYFPQAGYTKLDLVNYYLAVSDGALRGAGGRPMALKRYPNGINGEFFYQKRAPTSRPDWIETVELSFPSGRTAQEIVLRNAAQLAWIINLGCIDLHPHAVRAEDLDHPDELRIDLDPVPGATWKQIVEVAQVTRQVLEECKLTGWPKTSGSRGLHINVRILPQWSFTEVRRAALALAREVERRAPSIASSKWWKEERHGVFLDYNQNAKDRTVASAYSVRPLPDARVSAPMSWEEVSSADPADFTLRTVPKRLEQIGDPHAKIDDSEGSLAALLELSARDEVAGLGDAPWPPHYAKAEGEPPRVQPSNRRMPGQGRPGTGKRKSIHPLLEIGRAAKTGDALAGLERWKTRYPEAAALLQPEDILIDSMRGRFTLWTRIRVNLKNVPEAQRPPQEALDPDYDPWAA
jgi:DNA ligase D-like protein (predicted polymerase)